MVQYIFKRILLFIPALFVVSLLAFEIVLHAPGNSVETIIKSSQGNDADVASSAQYQQQVLSWNHKLGLDLPIFYFSIHSLAIADTLYKISDKTERVLAERKMLSNAGFKKYIPTISFYYPNQYHRWMFGDNEFTKGIIRGDFGISILSQQKILTIISEKLPWSLFFSIISILISYLISIPLGIIIATKKNTWFEKIFSSLIFILPALPSFWVASILLMFFSNPDFLNWFPSSGIAPVQGFDSSNHFIQQFSYFILPIICFSYSSIAFLTKTMNNSINNELTLDYITTAKAKGLSNKKVIWRHAFRNSLLPMITIYASVFPAIISGSVILETIFTLPGMGRTIYQAIAAHDYNLMIAIFTLTGFMTMLGFLISDILYTIADPRIRLYK